MPRQLFIIWLALAALLLALAAGGCCGWKGGNHRMIDQHIDREWFKRDLVEGNLAHWLAVAPTETGFFRTDVDRQWRPAEKQSATLVSQARMLYVMSAGHRVTGEAAYLDALRKGADFLLSSFRDEEHGGWVWSVSPSGQVLDDSKSAYGHAFVIFGLSHAAMATGDKRYADAALETWRTMKRRLRDEQGGIIPTTSRDWKTRRGGNSQNPMMHLFEALMALHDATAGEEVFADLGELAGFIFGRLYIEEAGCLPEMYDPQWRPRAGEAGGYVDVGHQFEWAFLLSRAVRKGLPSKYLAIGERLLAFGLAHGYDGESGGIFGRCQIDGTGAGGGKGWWQQCELLRALMRYAGDHGRADLWGKFDQSLAFAREHFIDAEYGGWYESYDPKTPRTDGPSRKGSVWKVGYHDGGMYMEGLRLTGVIGGKP